LKRVEQQRPVLKIELCSRVARFFWYNKPKWKIYTKMAIKMPKMPKINPKLQIKY
jgi:hypothetical protein